MKGTGQPATTANTSTRNGKVSHSRCSSTAGSTILSNDRTSSNVLLGTATTSSAPRCGSVRKNTRSYTRSAFALLSSVTFEIDTSILVGWANAASVAVVATRGSSLELLPPAPMRSVDCSTADAFGSCDSGVYETQDEQANTATSADRARRPPIMVPPTTSEQSSVCSSYRSMSTLTQSFTEPVGRPHQAALIKSVTLLHGSVASGIVCRGVQNQEAGASSKVLSRPCLDPRSYNRWFKTLRIVEAENPTRAAIRS